MKHDFDLIVRKFGEDLKEINIYPLGDLHVGSELFDEKMFIKWRDTVLNDPNGYVVIVGDLCDNGLKNSKTTSYEATLRPREQKSYLVEVLYPIAEKIIGIVDGNHEYRSVYASDDSPLYDVMCKLDLEELYRENMAFLKLNLGRKSSDRQFSYTVVLAHGKSESKTEKFSYAIDGMDLFVTGHTHRPKTMFPAKIVIDSHNEIIRTVGYTNVVVPSFQSFGGYALRDMYMPMDGGKFPVIKLGGTKKEVSVLWK